MKRASYYKLEYSLSLDGTYSKRLYYDMKLFEDKGFRTYLVDDMREKYECPPSYKKYSLLKARVIDPAVNEINTKTDLMLSYKEEFNKTKVVRLVFSIKKKK